MKIIYSLLFSSGNNKGYGYFKGTVQPDGDVAWEDWTADLPYPRAARSKVRITGDSAFVYVATRGNGTWQRFVSVAANSAVESSPNNLATFDLAQNYPNPFNPNTVVSYQLSVVSEVKLKVFDVLGREVATLVNAKQAAGNYSINFNASKLSSGVYFYRLIAQNGTGRYLQTRKMSLVK